MARSSSTWSADRPGPGRKPGKSPEKQLRERFKGLVESIDAATFKELLEDCRQRALGGSAEHLKLFLSYTVGTPVRRLEIDQVVEQTTSIALNFPTMAVQPADHHDELPGIAPALPAAPAARAPTKPPTPPARDVELLATIEASKPEPPQFTETKLDHAKPDHGIQRVVATPVTPAINSRVIHWDKDKCETLETDEARERRLWNDRDAWR